jgi:hypothetical protein
MDMLYPTNPVPTGQSSNYVSPLKNGTTPSLDDAQNALRMEKPSLVPEHESVGYRRLEDADDQGEKRGKKKKGAEQECQT